MPKKNRSTSQRYQSALQRPVSSAVRRLGRDLLDQQMWCWGYDIRRPAGNLLLTYGFTRYRPWEDQPGSSNYIFRPAPGRQIGLWGFGLFYGDERLGGLFLKRYEFSPKLTLSSQLPLNISKVAEMPASRKPQTQAEVELAHTLLGAVLGWISGYEQWVQAEAGADYRQQSVEAWHRKVAVPAGEMAAAWQKLAAQVSPAAGIPTGAA